MVSLVNAYDDPIHQWCNTATVTADNAGSATMSISGTVTSETVDLPSGVDFGCSFDTGFSYLSNSVDTDTELSSIKTYAFWVNVDSSKGGIPWRWQKSSNYYEYSEFYTDNKIYTRYKTTVAVVNTPTDTYASNTWVHVVIKTNTNIDRPTFHYLDGSTSSVSSTSYHWIPILANGFAIGNVDNFDQGINAIADFRIYDYELSDQNVTDLYDSYSSPTFNYTVTTVQEPSNLTSQQIGTLRINASVTDSIGNISDVNDSYTTLNYDVEAKANSDCGYINLNDGSCNSFATTENMTKLSNDEYTYFTNEIHYLPAVYPFDQEWLQDQTMNEHGVKGSTFMRFNVKNMTTNQSDVVNVEYNIEPFSTSGTYSLLVVYCNSSYTTGSVDPSINSNCALIDEILPSESFNHCHNLESCHYVSRLNKDITWTNNGYFMFGTLGTSTADSWQVNYAENVSYTTQSFSLTTNNGISWTPSNHIADIHLHQFATDDNIKYNVTFNDGLGNSVTSDTIIDYLDFVNAPPSTFVILTPATDAQYTINSTGVDVLFSWEATTDPEDDAIEYKVALSSNGFSPSMNLSSWLNESALNYTYTFDSLSYSNGDYRAFVYAQDENGAYTISPQTGTFNLCVNDWVATEQICIDGVANNTYSDLNNCPIEYEKPDSYLTNCQIETGNSDMTLILLWVIFGLLSIFFITQGANLGWFTLGLTVLFFSLTSLQTLTLEPMIPVMGYIFSVFLMAMSLTRYVFD